MTTPTSQAIEKVDQSPKALVKTYQDSFTAVLPSHIAKPETWIRLAQGALKKGKRTQSGQTELEVAAANNPPKFLSELLEAARLGLEPGTDEFYLTTRRPHKGAASEIQGIVGYQGYIELIYRAGAVSSVVCELVYSNDQFEYSPGRHQVPVHEIDWDSDDRGHLRLAYGYCRMKDGSFSKVIVYNRHDIARSKSRSPSASSDRSPWKNDEPSMWLKTVARQLRKWVPTSAEYRREQMRSVEAGQEQRETLELPAPEGGEDHYDDQVDVDEDGVVEAEIVNGDHDDDDPERPFD